MARPDPSVLPWLLQLPLALMTGHVAGTEEAPLCAAAWATPDACALLVQMSHAGQGRPEGSPVLTAGGDPLLTGPAFLPHLSVHAHLPDHCKPLLSCWLVCKYTKASCSPLLYQ